MDRFVKDANFKDSKHSHFVQIADLVAYAAFLKMKGERGQLTPWQLSAQLARAYDEIPSAALNTKASRTDPQGIVRLSP